MKYIPKLLLSISLASMMITSTCYADTVEDLYSKYGKSLYGAAGSELKEKIEEAESTINARSTEEERSKVYKEIVDMYKEQQEKDYNKIKDYISVYQDKNDDIASDINDNILTLSGSDLVHLDTAYKDNVDRINASVSAMNSYIFDDEYEYVEYDNSDIEKELADAKAEYEASVPKISSTSVQNIPWISDSTKSVGTPFGYSVSSTDSSTIRFKSGTTYNMPEGSNVYAMFNGTVYEVGETKSTGKYIIVTMQSNTKYMYTHLKDIVVSKGDTVEQGQLVAHSGSTGNVTTPCLYIALYINGSVQDPDKCFGSIAIGAN